jgi:hypothetical protein
MDGSGASATLAAKGSYDLVPSVDALSNPGSEKKGDFTMSDAELDELYAALRKAGADRIHLVKRKFTMYDAASASFTIVAGGSTWSVGGSAKQEVAPRDQDRFDATIAVMQAVIAKKVP